MDRKNRNFEVKVSLADLLRILIEKLWIMALAALVAGGSMYLYSSYTYKPSYTSTSKIYILRKENNETAQGYAQSLTAALNIVNDCKLIIKTETTMQMVIDDTGLDMKASSLLSRVSLSSSEDSRIVLITAKASDPETAKLIADKVAEKGIERIYQVMTYDQASLMENGRVPSSPSNSVYSSKITIVAFAAALLVYLFYIIKMICNDKISEPEQINDYLGLSVLGMIPNEDDMASKKKYRGHGYYKYKKYGKQYSNQYGQVPDQSTQSEDATQKKSNILRKKEQGEKK